MPSEFHSLKLESHHSQTAAAQGVGITLVAKPGEYVALFTCAQRCALVLGSRNLEITEVPTFRIPLQEMPEACQKLSQRYSVALVDYIIDKHGGRFVLVWKIPCGGAAPTPEPEIDWESL